MNAPDRARRTCIIADDDPAVRGALELAIANCGLAPRGFGNARDVLAACRQDAPDFIFLDVALQGSDAIDVIRALGDLHFHGAVQLMSGHHALLEQVKRVGERHGLAMLPPLQKPFRATQVEQIVKRYFSGPAGEPGRAPDSSA